MDSRPITPEELERVLAVMPEPNHAYVNLSAIPIEDLSDIVRKAEKLVPRLKLNEESLGRSIGAPLKHPSKEVILAIYKSSYGKDDLGHPDFTKPRVELELVSWHLEKPGRILESDVSLRPRDGFKIEYWGEEPAYIAGLRKALNGSYVMLQIGAHNYDPKVL